VLRDHLPFGEVPIKMYLHRRRQDDRRDDIGEIAAEPSLTAGDDLADAADRDDRPLSAAFDTEEPT
jgi:GTP-binding protein